MKKLIGKILYNLIGKHLPGSYSSIKLGQKKFRAFCVNLIFNYCGKNVNIERNANICNSISLGDYSGIGNNAKINGTCLIGNYVMMGDNCTILTRNHAFDRTDIPMAMQGFEEEKPVTIGNDVWIGDNVTILPGVHIGDGSIIAAGAVVTKSFDDYSIIGGVPARLIRKRK